MNTGLLAEQWIERVDQGTSSPLHYALWAMIEAWCLPLISLETGGGGGI
jgi:hypothetical protein